MNSLRLLFLGSVILALSAGAVTAQPHCTPPGVTASTDAANDQNIALGTAQDDILSVSVAEPFQPDLVQRLVFTMQLRQLDPSNLPPSRVWYMLFTPSNGSTTYFVNMYNCDPTLQPFAFGYGTFNATTGFTQIVTGEQPTGVARSDGTFEVSIRRSLVGNPPVGASLDNVFGDVRVFGGAACTGIVSRLDFSPNGTYPVQGNCAPPTGACCSSTGICSILTEAECEAQAGAYAGDDTACEPNPCPTPTLPTTWGEVKSIHR